MNLMKYVKKFLHRRFVVSFFQIFLYFSGKRHIFIFSPVIDFKICNEINAGSKSSRIIK